MEPLTVTIPNHNQQALEPLSSDALHAADFSFTAPFQLQLLENDVFFADKVVRIIPKRRMVVFGTWLGKSVVAKLFFSHQQAKRQMQKDVNGVKKLQDNKIPTPALLFQCQSLDKRTYVLIFERIDPVMNLEEIWQEKTSIDDIFPMLQAVTIELATQHVLGVLQHDLHLKNFLLTDKIIYTLDGAQIELFPHLLSKQVSMNNFALFLAQFGVGFESYQEKLFRLYAKSRGWRLKVEDITELFFTIRKWNEERWARYQKKIFRQSTEFKCRKNWRELSVYNRHYEGPEFLGFLKNPDALFQSAASTMLKAGRSATVIKVTLDQHELVIKRYNLKNIWHRLRRTFRVTRAAESWRLAQKLCLFGVATAKPVAFIEQRFFNLRGKSYYVTEYISGKNAGDYFRHYQYQDEKLLTMAENIVLLLKKLAKLEITHGDLKITNILLDSRDQPVLIDLDGAVEHASISSLDNAWRKEIKRFLKNFSDLPAVQKKIRMFL